MPDLDDIRALLSGIPASTGPRTCSFGPITAGPYRTPKAREMFAKLCGMLGPGTRWWSNAPFGVT